ncbi:hypothetical protein AHAS_Ahas06G0217200 [Arachis hypogaea]
MNDNTRRAELEERAGFHFAGLEPLKRLCSKTIIYSRDELNELNKRHEIRGFLFYPRGCLLPLKKYKDSVR